MAAQGGRVTRSGARGKFLASKGLALGDLTNSIAPGDRSQSGKAAGSLKTLFQGAVAAVAGAGKRKRASAAVAEVENERSDARPAKAGRVGPTLSQKRLQGRTQQEVITLDSDSDDDNVLSDTDIQDRRQGLAGPGPAFGTDPTHPGYSFCVTGGRRQVESKHPTGLYIFPQGFVLFSSYTRQILVDWVMGAHHGLKLDEETLHLAVRYVDQFLSRRASRFSEKVVWKWKSSSTSPVTTFPAMPQPDSRDHGPESFLTDPRKHQVLQEHPAVEDGREIIFPQGLTVEPLCNKLKRLGATCLFVASKVAEINSYSAVDFAHAAGVPLFNREQIILAERALLKTLSFDVYLPTATSFLGAIIDACEMEIRETRDAEFKFSKTFVEVAGLYADLTLLSHGALSYQPSQLAAAAMSVALDKCLDPAECSWASGKLARFTGYSLADLQQPRLLVAALARDALEMRRVVDREPKRSRVSTVWNLNLALNQAYPVVRNSRLPLLPSSR